MPQNPESHLATQEASLWWAHAEIPESGPVGWSGFASWDLVRPGLANLSGQVRQREGRPEESGGGVTLSPVSPGPLV